MRIMQTCIFEGDIMLIDNKKYAAVFGFFEEISAVPRGSGKTDGIARFCTDFAEKRGLEYSRDEYNNVVIRKPGSKGRENEAPVILQGHTDMVWEKDEGVDFDFETQGLRLAVDGDMLFAEGTTLGGDDGIAVAMCFAILDDDSLSHPPLEVILTSDEEIGMPGAAAFDTSAVKGKRMINLDSEAEGILWVSCAGGARADIELPVKKVNNTLPAYRFILSGFEGGHSGTEIDKGHANAAVEAGKLLEKICENTQAFPAEFTGGKMDNAITREASFVLCSDKDISGFAEAFEEEIKKAYPAEKNARVVCRKTNSGFCFDKASSEKLIYLVSSLPYGVKAMSREISELVQTSLNPGVAETNDERVKIGYSVRSSVNEEKEELLENLKNTADTAGAAVTVYGAYPAWEYRKESPLRDTMTAVYREMFGSELEVTAVHAGLECGLFSGKIPGLDCVSLGPDIFDIHTPKEKLSISSAKRVYDFVTETLKKI